MPTGKSETLSAFARVLANPDAPAAKSPLGYAFPSDAARQVTRIAIEVPAKTVGVNEYYCIYTGPTYASDVANGEHGTVATAGTSFGGAAAAITQSGLRYSSAEYGSYFSLTLKHVAMHAYLENTTAPLNKSGLVFSGLNPDSTSLFSLTMTQFMARPWVKCEAVTNRSRIGHQVWAPRTPLEVDWYHAVAAAPSLGWIIPCQPVAQSYMLTLVNYDEYAGGNIAGTASHCADNAGRSLLAEVYSKSTTPGAIENFKALAGATAQKLLREYGGKAIDMLFAAGTRKVSQQLRIGWKDEL